MSPRRARVRRDGTAKRTTRAGQPSGLNGFHVLASRHASNGVILPWVLRLTEAFVATRQLGLVAELPPDERNVVLDLAAMQRGRRP